MSSSMNIIVFGESGVGKSSLINLIAGRKIAETSPDALPHTKPNSSYSFNVGNRTFHIWETIGLEEPKIHDVKSYQSMIEKLWELIQQIAIKGGVDLLLFCYRLPRVTETVQSNYKLFHEVICGSRVPIALVIMHLEREADMESWWVRNALSLEKYGVRVAGHACITGLPAHPRYRESRQIMAGLLERHGGGGGANRFRKPPEDWFVEVLRAFGMFSILKEKAKKKKVIISVLTKRCGMDSKRATNLAKELTGV